MSKKLPVVSGKVLLKFFYNCGYYFRDQEGSHVHIRHPSKPPLTIPNHKEIARGTLRKILRESGTPPDKLRKFL